MSTFYAFVPQTEMDHGADPVTLLRTAPTLPALLADPTYNEDEVGHWSRSAVTQKGTTVVDITSRKTGIAVPAYVCYAEHI